MPTLQCKRCLDLHGSGCAATHETDAGEPSCVFCLDGFPCPVQRKTQRTATDEKALTTETLAANTAANLAGSTRSIAFVHRVGSSSAEKKSGVLTTMQTPETDAHVAPKTCKRPGCETNLGPKNSVGLCPRHVRWTGTSEERPSNGDGDAAAGSNGHQKAGNGSAEKANGHALKARPDGSTPANGSDGATSVLPELAADRVEQLLATLPPPTKAKMLMLFLRGAL
jgi:hypothetical protein